MNRLIGIFLSISIAALMFGCSDIEKSTGKNTVADYRYLDSLSCDSCIHLLVHSTNISPLLKNAYAKEDGISNDTMLIKIYHRTETQQGSFYETADGFINVDMKKRKVYLINTAEEKSESIQFDNNILDHFITKCLATKPAVQ